ncbi:hypothetical protein MBLNU230_g6154t1 [Neophaeotheca triangularis]
MPSSKAIKPRIIMRAKKVSPALRKLYAENQENSPLLRLPPEIRNRIWGYVLGGHTIHIYTLGPTKNARVLHCLCLNEKSDAEEIDHLRSLPLSKRHTYLNLHSLCVDGVGRPHKDTTNAGSGLTTADVAESTVPSAGRLSLALLHACRQIHQEAALLPFVDNTFSFPTDISVKAFSMTLIREQARAVLSLTLCIVGTCRMSFDFQASSGTRLGPGVLSRLTLHLESSCSLKQLPLGGFDTRVQRLIEQFTMLSAKSAQTLIAYYRWNGDPDDNSRLHNMRRLEEIIEDSVTGAVKGDHGQEK